MSWAVREMSVSPFRELLRVALVHGSDVQAAIAWALAILLNLVWLGAVLFCLFKARMAQIRYMRSVWSPLRGPDGKPRPPAQRLVWEGGRWVAALLFVLAMNFPVRALSIRLGP